MLIWLVLIPLIAAALIGLCKAPARPTALLSASLTLALGIWALVSFDGCSSCWSRFEGMDLQLTLAPALSKVMLLLTILVTFATVLGTNPPQGGEASWYNSALLISAGATGAASARAMACQLLRRVCKWPTISSQTFTSFLKSTSMNRRIK